MIRHTQEYSRDPGANLIGRHNLLISLLDGAGGVLLLTQVVQGFPGELTYGILTKTLMGFALLSTSDALGRNYKPKASRFPFGHTSTKRFLMGLWYVGNSALYITRSMQVASYGLVTLGSWVAAGGIAYYGVQLCLRGLGFGVAKKIESFPPLDSKRLHELKALSQPVCFQVQASASFEHLSDSSYIVWHVQGLQDAPAISDPTLRTIDITQIFKEGTVAFGFGRPNVFLMKVAAGGNVIRVDAKSLYRAATAVTTTVGKVQSGIFLVPRELNSETLADIEKAAFEMVGTTGVTCVHTNVAILAQVGFSVPGQSLESFTLPDQLLKAILQYGLEYKGEPVEFDVIRTTQDTLTNVVSSITRAMVSTPRRHLFDKKKDDAKAKNDRAAQAQRITLENATRLASIEEVKLFAALRVWASEPSDMGRWARWFWGAHPIYRVALDGINVAQHLPVYLSAFPQETPSWSTLIKRDVLFSPLMLDWLSQNLAKTFHSRGMMAVTTLANMLPVNERRNFVISDNELIIVVVGQDTVSWALGKHVLAAASAGKGCPVDDRGFPKARGAGEVWRDKEGNFHVNANSGTFMPMVQQLEATATLARLVFPGINIIVERE